MTNDDYWGATEADLPRIRPAERPERPVDAPADTPGDELDATAPLDAVDLPTPLPRPDAAASGPAAPDGHDPDGHDPDAPEEPLYRTTGRMPRTELAPDEAPVPTEPQPPLPPTGATALPATDPDQPPDRQHKILVLVLVLALVAVGGIIVWRALSAGQTQAVPIRTSTTTDARPTPAPPPTSPSPLLPPVPPPPLPPPEPAPARTITQTVLVTVPPITPTPTPVETPTTPGTTIDTPSAAPSAETWLVGPTGVGPITLGMPVATAAAQGYVVPDPAAPGGYVTAPHLAGIDLWIVNGAITGMVLTDPALKTAQHVGVGTPLAQVEVLSGVQLVVVTLKDAAGTTRNLPALDYPASFIAFVPSNEVVVTPSPTGSGSPSGSTGAPTSATTSAATTGTTGGASPAQPPAAEPTVVAIIVAQKPAAGPSGAPSGHMGG